MGNLEEADEGLRSFQHNKTSKFGPMESICPSISKSTEQHEGQPLTETHVWQWDGRHIWAYNIIFSWQVIDCVCLTAPESKDSVSVGQIIIQQPCCRVRRKPQLSRCSVCANKCEKKKQLLGTRFLLNASRSRRSMNIIRSQCEQREQPVLSSVLLNAGSSTDLLKINLLVSSSGDQSLSRRNPAGNNLYWRHVPQAL